jgi:hypothetical protein
MDSFRADSKKCGGCVSYHSCMKVNESAHRPSLLSELACALRSWRPFGTLLVLGSAAGGVLAFTSAVALAKPDGPAGRLLSLAGVDVRIVPIERASATAPEPGRPINLAAPWASSGGSVLVREDVVARIDDAIRRGDAETVASEKAKLSHEAGHVLHRDSLRMAASFGGLFSASYLTGYTVLSPLTMRMCRRYPTAGAVPMYAIHAALLVSSLLVARAGGRPIARAIETAADDNITDEAALEAIIKEVAEEKERAEKWMALHGVDMTNPDQVRAVYLKEDPLHPPLNERLTRFKWRLNKLKGLKDDAVLATKD